MRVFDRRFGYRHMLHSGVEKSWHAMEDNRAAAETAILIRTTFRGSKRNRKMLPVDHVRTDGVRPVHIAPNGRMRIVLVEHVILALPVDRPVRIVHPIGSGQQMILRTIRVTSRTLCGKGMSSQHGNGSGTCTSLNKFAA